MKLILGIAVFSALLLGMSGTASAGHSHFYGCGHSGYAYGRPAYPNYYQRSVYPDYWHNHYSGGRYGRRHYYGGSHHFAVGYSTPVYGAPVYPNYWHNHFYGERNVRCHYYGGRHHYGSYYRPRTNFHFGISIFR